MQLQNLFQPIVDLIPFFGLIHKLTWNKDWIANFCPIFSSFFKNKIFLSSETKSSGKGQSCFSFLLFFSKCVGDYTVLLSSCIPKRVVQKASYFFFIIIIVSWIQKWDFISHFSYSFFFLLSIYPLAKWYVVHSFHLLNCDAIGWIFFIQLLLGRVKKDSVLNSK